MHRKIELCNDDIKTFLEHCIKLKQVIQDLSCISSPIKTHSLIEQQSITEKVDESAKSLGKTVHSLDYKYPSHKTLYKAVIFCGQRVLLSTSPSLKMTSILKTIGSVVSSKGLDKPTYEVLSSEKEYELRRYPPAKWVSYKTKFMKKKDAQTDGFWKLFNYIQGENEKEMKVEMTAPVSTRIEPGAGPNCESTFTVSFFIPPEHQENPPQPKNPDVFLEERPGFEAYVRTFGGFANEESWVNEARKLTEDLKEKTEEIRQDYWYSAGYNSPFQLFGRTNEIWFVKK